MGLGGTIDGGPTAGNGIAQAPSAGSGPDWTDWLKLARQAYQDYSQNDFCTHGQNANGWIATGVNTAAKGALPIVDNLYFDNSMLLSDSLATNFKMFLTGILKLDLDHHSPWLTADWQYQYWALVAGYSRTSKLILSRNKLPAVSK